MRRPFWTFVAIRAAFWLGTALALLWAPVHGAAVAPERGWGPLSDVFFGAFDHWDAQWFLHIARDGYSPTSAAFFPLHPLVLHLPGSSRLGNAPLARGRGIRGIRCRWNGSPGRRRRGRPRQRPRPRARSDRVRLHLAHSDRLFLCFSTASFLAAERGRPWLAGIAGGLAVATRRVGPLGGLWDALREGWHSSLEILRHLPRGQGGAAGLAPTDQLAFWNTLHLLVLVAAVGLTWVAWRRLGPAFGLYSAATLALVLTFPSSAFPLVSLPRFVMTDFPLVIATAALVQGRPALRTGVLVALGTTSAVAGVAFARDVWIS